MIRHHTPSSFPKWALPHRSLLTGSALLFLAVLLVYTPILGGQFLWDDDSVLLANPLIAAKDGLYRIWFTTEPIDYFPLVYSSFWLEWRLWGPNPVGYQLFNLALHGTSAVLTWRVLRSLSIPGAWVAALLFAVHPVNVESVAWITQRKNTLPMVLYLLSILAYLRHIPSRGHLWYGLSLAAFLAALLGKTMVVPLPFVLLLCLWWRNGHLTKRNVQEVLPFFALALLLGLVTLWFQYTRAISGEIVRPEGLLSRLAGVGWVTWFYLSKAVLPLRLSFVYPRWDIDPSQLSAWLPLCALVGVFLLLWHFRASWGRPWLFALGYFAATLFPVLGFFDIYFMRYSLVADHWQYPSIIAIPALATGMASYHVRRHWKKPEPILLTLAAATTIALAAGSWDRAQVFRNNDALWNDTLAKNPTAWMAHNNLGADAYSRGDLSRAVQSYRAALQLYPEYTEAWLNLAVAENALGNREQRDYALSHALHVRSKEPNVHLLVANYLLERNRFREAEESYRQALALDPRLPDALVNMGVVLSIQGKIAEALPYYQQAILLQPEDLDLRTSLGNVLLDYRMPKEAEIEYRRALSLRSDLSEARFGLAVALLLQGRHSEAMLEHASLAKSDPAAAAELLKILANPGEPGGRSKSPPERGDAGN